MGSSETDTPTKAATGAPQKQQPPATTSSSATPAVYPEWSGFQYSAIPPPGFFHSGHQAHPYMWGPQHLMPPYGTPPPPYVMYPHRGVYAHPSMPPASHPFSPYAMPSPNGNTETSVPLASGMELDGKSSDGKEKSPFKRSKGSLGSLNMITGKSNNELGKTSGASANGGSHRYAPGESGSEGSSEGSDANSQNDKTNGGHGSYDEEASENVNAARTSQNGVAHPSSQATLNHPMPIMIMAAAGVPGVGGPTTALNIGMDYGGAPNPSSVHPVRGKVPATTVAGAILPGGITGSCENIPSELWQDERDLKRQRRKQSNRESARRSRLRKQAECEELAQRVDVLKAENSALRAEVERVRKEYDQLLAQNTSLKERLEGTQLGTVDIRPESASRATDSDSQTGPEIGL